MDLSRENNAVGLVAIQPFLFNLTDAGKGISFMKSFAGVLWILSTVDASLLLKPPRLQLHPFSENHTMEASQVISFKSAASTKNRLVLEVAACLQDDNQQKHSLFYNQTLNAFLPNQPQSNQSQLSNEKKPSCLGYIGDYTCTTQLNGAYNKPF